MKVFFDTEFTGLHKDTTLISIGLIDEYDNYFYAEFNDYDESQVDDFIKDNVSPNLLINSPNYIGEYGLHYHIPKNKCFTEILSNKFTYVYGDKSYIRDVLTEWLAINADYYKEDTIELVSDVCHYDMVLFADIFGGAFETPHWIVPACIDINQIIMEHENCTAQQAFDLNREELLNDLYVDKYSVDNVVNKINFNLKGNLDSVFTNKHNSMWDARIIKELYCVMYDCPNIKF